MSGAGSWGLGVLSPARLECLHGLNEHTFQGPGFEGFPQGPCVQIVYTLGPMYFYYGEYFKALRPEYIL